MQPHLYSVQHRAIENNPARYVLLDKPDMPRILQDFQGYLQFIHQVLYQTDKHPLSEEELSDYFQVFLLTILGNGKYCEEVDGNPGDLKITYQDYTALVRLRTWDGSFSRRGWIKQLEKDLYLDWVAEGYLVLFYLDTPGPLPQGWLSRRETDLRIYEIGIGYGDGVRV